MYDGGSAHPWVNPQQSQADAAAQQAADASRWAVETLGQEHASRLAAEAQRAGMRPQQFHQEIQAQAAQLLTPPAVMFVPLPVETLAPVQSEAQAHVGPTPVTPTPVAARRSSTAQPQIRVPTATEAAAAVARDNARAADWAAQDAATRARAAAGVEAARLRRERHLIVSLIVTLVLAVALNISLVWFYAATHNTVHWSNYFLVWPNLWAAICGFIYWRLGRRVIPVLLCIGLPLAFTGGGALIHYGMSLAKGG